MKSLFKKYFLIFSIFILSGCAVLKNFTSSTNSIERTQLLFLPFYCENAKVGLEISKGFTTKINKNFELIQMNKFKAYISSHPIDLPDYFPAGSSIFISVSTGAHSSDSPFERLMNDLFYKEDVREKFFMQSGIDYLVIGKAKEQDLSDLQFGNLVTAETAEMKLLELKTGELLVEDTFKQGLFEIVAPDRIGSKFAVKVNDKLNQLKKEVRTAEKQERRLRKYERMGY